jgi:novobiocin biosynthesis protein NovU/D-mycarose 3-C-methyltransferase
MEITHCPISGSAKGVEYLNLGNVPLVNNLCATRDESLKVDRFPLAIQLFPESNLTCLTEIVDKDQLFLNYLYRSGVNKPYLAHCADMYDYLINFIHLEDKDLVVDIGGNDGSLLQEFRKKNPRLRYANVDCSHSFEEMNREAGIEYINEYFGETTSLPIKAKLITSTNVFQHTEPIRTFVKGIYQNLTSDGMWCLEFPYILTTLLNDNYDQIYHEHVYYFCLRNIIDLAEQEGLKVINVSYHDMHAGTLRVLLVRKSSSKKSDITIPSFLNLEKTITEEYCLRWGKRTLDKINEFKNYIIELVSDGQKIAGFGAAAKGCVFLNSVGIDNSMIEFIVDDTPFKQGKFVPGTGIQVMPREYLQQSKIDYILILAHNFKDYIIDSLKGQYDGNFIVMFPEIKKY